MALFKRLSETQRPALAFTLDLLIRGALLLVLGLLAIFSSAA